VEVLGLLQSSLGKPKRPKFQGSLRKLFVNPFVVDLVSDGSSLKVADAKSHLEALLRIFGK
jgi:hypothetical protein